LTKVFTYSRRLDNASSLLDCQPGGRCGVSKREPVTDPVREEKFDLVVEETAESSVRLSDCLRGESAPNAELHQAHPLDILAR